LIRQGSELLGLSVEELVALPSRRPEKRMLCALVSMRCGVTREWIAKKIVMGSTRPVYNAVESVKALKGAHAKQWKKL
jgi:hypothetical protein